MESSKPTSATNAYPSSNTTIASRSGLWRSWNSLVASSTTSTLDHCRIEALANGRYNADREAFLDAWRRRIMFLVIVLGAGAVSQVLGPSAAPWIGLVTAILGAADLVLDLSTRSRSHAELRQSYFDVAAALTADAANPIKERTAMMSLAAKEEPPYFAAHALAENWATEMVLGFAHPKPCKVNWLQRILRNYYRFGGSSFV